MNEELRMDFDDGKYTVVYYDNGKLVALRFGEVWRDLTGDKMVFWMLHEANQLREQRDELLKALAASMQHIATNVVACNGLKCREAVCMSCNGEEDAEVAAKAAFDAYVAAGNLIAKIRGEA